ncbi:IS4 family transposase [Bradyrhizobium diazoefficiens]|nr:IS4 family transposase [Bradyrhizobium diazoefficiens]QQO33673.1 IS4 family transposase [Bradyrhizobium diazoefficiens]QQO35208.1 IS4 family transposase [Bradyrhizobium diazoefficiens]
MQRVSDRQTICLRQLGDTRAEQVAFRRFVLNDRVTVSKMVLHQRARVAEASADRHVLVIQDTSEINYESQRERKRGLGTVGNGRDVGLFVHPMLAVDAEHGHCLGLLDVQVWRRLKAKSKDYRKQPIEEKESYRWLKGPQRAKAALGKAVRVTVIDDREGDIYEKWARLPDRRTELLTRACRDRAMVDGGTLFAAMAELPERHSYSLDLPARPGKKRQARQARLTVRFGRVRIRRPQSCSDRDAPEEIELSAIEVIERDPPAKETPVHWRLLTTHAVDTAAQALTVIGWYRQRWHIEQLFRTVKSQGLKIEESVAEDGEALEKLAVIALIGATTSMQLVLARAAPHHDQPASHVFDDRQIEVLEALQDKLQGRTIKQQNPYPPQSLAWAAWTIARLGGWTGYESERSTGPITMSHGLTRFNAIAEGYFLDQDVCSR